MKSMKVMAASLSAVLTLAGCANTPMGPRVQAMPAAGKPFEVFVQEQAMCKQYAADQVGGQAQAANERAIGTGLVGAGLAAGLGAAVNGGRGAGIGAAAGALGGSAIGAGNSERDQRGIQQQYDNAYSQCMYAKGNQVAQPVAPVMVVHPAPVYVAPPPVVYTQPPVVYSQPPVVYSQQPGYAAPPPAGYAAPPSGYAAPPPSGYAPPPSGSAPPPGYAPPPGSAPPPPPPQ